MTERELTGIRAERCRSSQKVNLVMAPNPKTNKYPKTVLSFYVELYCKKIDSNNLCKDNLIIAATKSWASLSEEDKEHFGNKFQEFQNTYKKALAGYLKRAIPVKRNKNKQDRNIFNIKDSASLINTHDDNQDYSSICSKITEDNVKENGINIDLQFDQPAAEQIPDSNPPAEDDESFGNKQILGNVQNEDPYNHNNTVRCIPEPTPLTVKNAKELYELLKADDRSSIPWESLSATQKSRYRDVTLSLKKDYIKRYRAYLENLTPQDLYNHYNKIL